MLRARWEEIGFIILYILGEWGSFYIYRDNIENVDSVGIEYEDGVLYFYDLIILPNRPNGRSPLILFVPMGLIFAVATYVVRGQARNVSAIELPGIHSSSSMRVS